MGRLLKGDASLISKGTTSEFRMCSYMTDLLTPRTSPPLGELVDRNGVEADVVREGHMDDEVFNAPGNEHTEGFRRLVHTTM